MHLDEDPPHTRHCPKLPWLSMPQSCPRTRTLVRCKLATAPQRIIPVSFDHRACHSCHVCYTSQTPFACSVPWGHSQQVDHHRLRPLLSKRRCVEHQEAPARRLGVGSCKHLIIAVCRRCPLYFRYHPCPDQVLICPLQRVRACLISIYFQATPQSGAIHVSC